MQINLQHCKEASSVLNNLLCKLQAGIAIIQEPWIYQRHIRGLNVKYGRIHYDTSCDSPRACILTLGNVQARMLRQYTSRDVVAIQVTLQVAGGNRTVVVSSAYLPYDATDPPPSQELVSLIDYCSQNDLPIIIGCDANAHHTYWGSSDTNERGRALLEYLVTTDLDILNKGTKPTFVISNRQEVIDITLVSRNIESYVTGWRVSDEESLSDHRQIQFHINSDQPILPPWRNPRATRWDAYYADLEEKLGGHMTVIETTDDIENEVAQLQSSLETSYKNNCKEKKHYPKKGALWWHPDLEKMRKQCRRNIRRARRGQLDRETARNDRKQYKKRIRRSQRESWSRFCGCVAGPRPAARLFKILGKDRTVDIDNIVLPEGAYASTTGETLEYLLDTHFPGNVKHTIVSQSEAACQASPEDWQVAKKIVTDERVEWAISLFAPFKSPGLDGIFPALLQKGLDIILSRLVSLFRACVALGYVPYQWRTSRVVFLPKPGRTDYTQVKSFRPISLTSFLMKTVERLIDRYLRDGTLVWYPLSKNQHAYLAGKSTDTALHNLVGKIERALDNKAYALGIFLDIEGAFNNALPTSLRSVLQSKGVTSTVIRWIDSMLSNRIARAQSGEASVEVSLLRGFPQGGVLSALMWILIADGLLIALNSVGYFAQGFADDFSILVEGIDLSTVCSVMQTAIKKVEQWCRDHKLSVNPKKTEMVLFTRKRKLNGLKPIRAFGEELERSNQVKYLGVILDSKLNWRAHLESKCSKAVATFCQCRRIVGKTWGITPKIAHWIYIAVIRPMLTYAAVVWWPRVELKTAITTLGRVQRLACMAITGAIRTTPTAAMEILLGLPPLDTYVKSVAMNTCYRLSSTSSWRSVGEGHTRIRGMMGALVPVTNMCGDCMIPHFDFDRRYAISIPTRENWEIEGTHLIPKDAITVYTDGSGETSGTGAGVFFNGWSEDLSIPLGKDTSVFQAETYAVLRCGTVLKTLDLASKTIYICSDSQATIKALRKPKITSKLVRECRTVLNELAVSQPVCLTWVPGHTGIQGNERADQLARQASTQDFVGPEPALPISHTVVKTAIRRWVEKDIDTRWQALHTCRQTKEMITGRSHRRERDLLRLPRQILRLVVGLLTGHAQLNRHLSIMGSTSNPFCSYCDEAIESASHFLCYCNYFGLLRRSIWGKHCLHPMDIDSATVGDMVRFIKKISPIPVNN